MPADPDPEKVGEVDGDGEDEAANVPKTGGLSQSSKDDLRVCVVIILVNIYSIVLFICYWLIETYFIWMFGY